MPATKATLVRGLWYACVALASGPVLATHALAESQQDAVRRCTGLARPALPGARVIAAEVVAAGAFTVVRASPEAPDLRPRLSGLPAFCRVQAQATPTPQSRIGIEIWLPLRNWNGRFLGTGNGGSAGSIGYAMGMIEGLKRGFATANTDMGTAPDIGAAASLPERWIDFGHRATHEMTRVAKAVVRQYYAVSTFRSYFEGCSTGGQQALVTAQRYPTDYDGILAGAPGSNRTHSTSYFIWNYQAVNAIAGSAMSQAQWQAVTGAVIAACGGKDGGAPGETFLNDPRACHFDPATLPKCEMSTGSDPCFTGAQIASLRRLYAGPVNPRTGERIYPGLTLGSEALPLGPGRMNDPAALNRLFVMRWALGADFDGRRFDFDHDQDRLDARLAGMLNANASDLGEFSRRGGKLILYSGMADPGVPFADVVQYYEGVRSVAGDAEAQRFIRLFLIPGMGHCFGGPGPSNVGQPFSEDVPPDARGDALLALVAWTERAVAPDVLVARSAWKRGGPVPERPVCAYPALPSYAGGDQTKRSSFVCRTGPRGAEQQSSARYLN